MKVNLKNAVTMLFNRSCFETVYYEAVSNSLDANATEITITTSWDGKNVDSASVCVKDNGIGFTDDRFSNFCKLFDAQNSQHKGLGRLAYLFYFDKISISSIYQNRYKREFVFDADFDGHCSQSSVTDGPNGTQIVMSDYSLKKFHSNNVLTASYIKTVLYQQFIAKLLKLKDEGKHIIITSESYVGTSIDKQILDTDLLPDFYEYELNEQFDLFDDAKMFYSILKTEDVYGRILTSVAIDDRCFSFDIMNRENVPNNYDIVFVLISNHFDGRSDVSRQADTFTKEEKDQIIDVFKTALLNLLPQKISEIKSKRERIIHDLNNTYPHLIGYFPQENIGFTSKQEIIQNAQEKFLKDQRDLLGAVNLDERQYEQTLDMASRSLAQYILFRQNIISKLSSLTPEEKEAEFHNILVPMRSIQTSSKGIENFYTNNMWVLDERFMTFDTVLSDCKMDDVINVITSGEEQVDDDDRPDIVLVFSDNPSTEGAKVDVVIVELKRKGLKIERNSDVEIQLETRARALSRYYDNHIQRIWYYGIVDINDEYAMHLETNHFIELYSKGLTFYKTSDIVVSRNPRVSIPSTMVIMDMTTVINDANARNTTFLNILKSKFNSNRE